MKTNLGILGFLLFAWPNFLIGSNNNSDLFQTTLDFAREIENDLNQYYSKISNNGRKDPKIWQAGFKAYIKRAMTKHQRRLANVLKKQPDLYISEKTPMNLLSEDNAAFDQVLYLNQFYTGIPRDSRTVSVSIIAVPQGKKFMNGEIPSGAKIHGRLKYAGKCELILSANEYLTFPETTGIDIAIHVLVDDGQISLQIPKPESEAEAPSTNE